jgi:hypothetical protein
MSSLSAKDRVSLCMFSFADGRRCRTPRIRNHPHFCYYHAEKEARARAAQSLGTDLARYFSGNYLSACDLSTALGCLIPAVIRGDVKPKVARTVAYMAQTLLQSIHISQDEYINAFDTNGWRKSIRTSVNSNHIYRFPPAPKPEQPQSRQPQPAAPTAEPLNVAAGLRPGVAPQSKNPREPQPQPTPARPSAPPKPAQTPVNCHSDAVAKAACPEGTRRVRPEESASSSNSSLATHHSFIPSEAEGPLPQPLPPTAAEFAQQILARNSSRPDRARSVPQPAQATQSASAETAANCHSERREESASSHSPLVTSHSPLPQTPAQPACPEQGRTDNSPNPKPPTPQRAPHRDHYAVHYDHTCPLRVDGKLV